MTRRYARVFAVVSAVVLVGSIGVVSAPPASANHRNGAEICEADPGGKVRDGNYRVVVSHEIENYNHERIGGVWLSRLVDTDYYCAVTTKYSHSGSRFMRITISTYTTDFLEKTRSDSGDYSEYAGPRGLTIGLGPIRLDGQIGDHGDNAGRTQMRWQPWYYCWWTQNEPTWHGNCP